MATSKSSTALVPASSITNTAQVPGGDKDAFLKAIQETAPPRTLEEWFTRYGSRGVSVRRAKDDVEVYRSAGAPTTGDLTEAAQIDCDATGGWGRQAYVITTFDGAERWALTLSPSRRVDAVDAVDLFGADNLNALSRSALLRPAIRTIPLKKAYRSMFSLGVLDGKAGQNLTSRVSVEELFRPERFIAVDTATPEGSGSILVGLFVGMRNQLPALNGGILTSTLSPNALGTGFMIDVFQPGIDVVVQVQFLKDCQWSGTLFGTSQ